ncbi:MAG: indolepyruvate ferredoxin oxidoreductase [Planctomycetes bacterium]|nr:indolepyruvate ferredoxin oxidoreductase [Planctomycetota bacterium]
MRELLLGDEAVAVAAIDAGIRGAFSYPGTPATEILEAIEERLSRAGTVPPDQRIAARWSTNEKVAYEEALGMSFTGRRALVSMKHVGLNVAADPFMSSALTGALGGLVVIVADDPGMHSSQNEQDTRYYGDFARLPLFEPSNQQEAYDATREAFVLSERVGLPVVVRLVTRLAHSRAAVERRPREVLAAPLVAHGDPNDWTLLPVNARRRFRRLLELQPVLAHYAEHSPFNTLTLNGRKGIIASGIAVNYVREVLGHDSSYSLLKVGAYPAPAEMVRKLVDHCDDILVVEDGYPFIEGKLNGLLGVPGKIIRGKLTGALRPDGEMTVDQVQAALQRTAPAAMEPLRDLPGRPPQLCNGCPHCDTFRAIVEAVAGETSAILFSDIGCYTLGAFPPYNAVHTCVDMGASISMALGAAKAGVRPVLCTIGDSTFTHSGMTPLLSAVHENADMTVFILDNAAVAMTGGQEVFTTGEGLLRLLRGLGVDEEHLIKLDPLPRHHEQNVALVRREVDHRGLSVVVAARPCIHLKRRAIAGDDGRAATGGPVAAAAAAAAGGV